MNGYVELQCTSHFSFLRGASSAYDLFARAKELGFTALGIADHNTLAGIVRAHVAAKEHGVRLVVGCRLDLEDGTVLLVYPMDRAAYSRLCRLLTIGKGRGGKSNAILNWQDLELYGEGLIAVLIPDEADDITQLNLKRIRAIFADRAYMALTLRRRPNDALRLFNLSNLAASAKVQTIVTNDVLFHIKERRLLQDVVTCIRHGCTIDTLGFRRERHSDRHLKSPEEMARLFMRFPEALARTQEIAERCSFSLDELRYQYPEECSEPGLTPQQTLERLTWEGARVRYGDPLPESVVRTLKHELGLIEQLQYAPYFLTVHSVVKYARSVGILCQGRGSAANSAVCYVLGVTSLDPGKHDLLFERFVSMERNEPPDIDIDFEHERREEVIQWVYDTYGRDRAALCATVQRFRAKGALRDVGKVLGFSQDMIDNLSGQMSYWDSELLSNDRIRELNIDPHNRRLRLLLTLAGQLINSPRHLGQHPGGFVLTHDRLDELVPIEPATMKDRQIIEWDKDDIDALRFMKVDVLGLGMLTCIRRCFDFIEQAKGIRYDLTTVPQEDPATYAMMRRADTLGVFQIESRAQMSMLPRLKPATFYDIVIQVAIVRPGPIQGDMVHPFLRRREGLEPVVFPTPQLEKILGKTLGVPLFQEAAMRVAIECAGFTPGEADALRRSMATFKFTGGVSKFYDRMINGMVANGYDQEFAERTFKQISGFGSYGFPESHAASFAILAYISSWIKCHHPDAFCAGLLNSQPMGFYAPAQIVRDAREHGIEVRPVCINASRWDCTLEPTRNPKRFAVRLGLRQVKGLKNADAAKIIAARQDRPFTLIEDVWMRSKVSARVLKRLADADAFLSAFAVGRKKAYWEIEALRDDPLPLFAALFDRTGDALPEMMEPQVTLKPSTEGSEVVQDYSHVGLTLRNHPLWFLRQDLAGRGYKTCREAMNARDGQYVQVAGMVLVRQRPGSANGVLFITIEDETGVCNVIVWSKQYDIYRRAILGASMLLVSGLIQREGEVVHLITRNLADLSHDLASVSEKDAVFPRSAARGDEFRHGAPMNPDQRTKEALKVKTRDFN